MKSTRTPPATPPAAPPSVDLSAQIAALPSLDMAELWAIWDRYFPFRPRHLNRRYLEARIAYKLQEAVHGGLDPALRRRLQQIGAQHSRIPTRDRRTSRRPPLLPGTVLLREWGQTVHQVTVTAGGTFAYEGIEFESLSAVARHITGTRWNGPRFFGLPHETRR